MLLEQVILQREKKPFLGFFNHFSVNIFLRDEREKKMHPSALKMQIEMVAPPPSLPRACSQASTAFFLV